MPSYSFVSAIFVTFSGNCKEALTFYQTCFGGTLQFQTLEKELPGYSEVPVVNGSLVANNMIIHGSDLVHTEGRILGNYMAIFMQFTSIKARKDLIEKLGSSIPKFTDDEKLIEIVDAFQLRWVLSI